MRGEEAVFLGIVQGLTEFLPVSSSGHLLLSQYILGMDKERFGLPFDAAIHTGTVLAVVLFFRRDLSNMARAFLRSLPRPDFADAEVRMAYLILVATVPAALIGFFFEDFFATEVRSPWVVVFNLAFVGVLFLVAESVGHKTESASKLDPLGAFGVGLAQAAAPIPGVSRSGATITCGLFLGLRREEAAAAGLSLAEATGEGMDGPEALMFLAGSASSGVVGYLTIRLLLRFLANHTLRIFAYYRFALVAVVAAVLLSAGT
jgi:undecaprenyl-diphosphatase